MKEWVRQEFRGDKERTVGWWPGRTLQRRWNLTATCIYENKVPLPSSLSQATRGPSQRPVNGRSSFFSGSLEVRLLVRTFSSPFLVLFVWKGNRFSCYNSQKKKKKTKINQERNGKNGPGNEVKISSLVKTPQMVFSSKWLLSLEGQWSRLL